MYVIKFRDENYLELIKDINHYRNSCGYDDDELLNSECFLNNYSSESLCFCYKGNVIGYVLLKNIILKNEELNSGSYTSVLTHIFCPNPAYLYDIINIIGKIHFKIAVSFNLLKDEYSNKILNTLYKKNIIKLLSSNYFDVSNNKYMILEFEEKPIVNIKYHLSEIASGADDNFLTFKDIIFSLHNDYGYSFEEIDNHKKRIITYLYNYQLSFYSMIGNFLNLIVKMNRYYKNPKKVFDKCIEDGCIDIDSVGGDIYNNTHTYRYHNSLDKYVLCPNDNDNVLCEIKYSSFPLLEPIYSGKNISYFRGVLRRQFNYYRKRLGNNLKKYEKIDVLDKYNRVLYNLNSCIKTNFKSVIPYYSAKNFDNSLNQCIFEEELDLYCDYLEKEFNIDSRAYLIEFLSLIKKKFGIHAFEKVRESLSEYIYTIKDDNKSFIHDYIYPREAIFNMEMPNSKKIINNFIKKYENPFLTKTAIITLFTKFSINKINSVKEKLRILDQDLSIVKNLDVVSLRKEISKTIKNNDYKGFCDIIDQIKILYNECCRKRLKLKKEDSILAEKYIGRLNIYNENISIFNFFNTFKGKAIDFIKGKYEGTFIGEEINMDYVKLGDYITKVLKANRRDKHIQKLFTALNKIKSISNIKNGEISKLEYDKIIDTLMHFDILIPKYLMVSNDFYSKIEYKCSPEFLIAGDASVCCMSYGSKKSRIYATEKGFGIYNVYYKNRIIANSLIWINTAYNCLVIDNIEVAPNYQDLKYSENIKHLYFKFIKTTLERYSLKFAIQGSKYNDLLLYDDNDEIKPIKISKFEPLDIKNKKFYSDARFAYPISINLSSEEIINYIKDINSLNKDGFDKIENFEEDYYEDEDEDEDEDFVGGLGYLPF